MGVTQTLVTSLPIPAAELAQVWEGAGIAEWEADIGGGHFPEPPDLLPLPGTERSFSARLHQQLGWGKYRSEPFVTFTRASREV